MSLQTEFPLPCCGSGQLPHILWLWAAPVTPVFPIIKHLSKAPWSQKNPLRTVRNAFLTSSTGLQPNTSHLAAASNSGPSSPDPLVCPWSHAGLILITLLYLVAKSRLTPWTIALQDPQSMGLLQARIPEWVAMPSSERSSPTQGSNPGLPHCRRILDHLPHQGSPRILGWVACPFSRGSSRPALQADSLSAELPGKPHLDPYQSPNVGNSVPSSPSWPQDPILLSHCPATAGWLPHPSPLADPGALVGEEKRPSR